MKPKKCPVCDWEIKDGGKAMKLKSGTIVVVCSDECAKKVKAAPEKFTARQ